MSAKSKLLRRLAGLVPALLLTSLAAPGWLAGQTPTSPLEFMGFNPGLSRKQVETLVTSHGGEWRCAPSKVDHRFSECRGVIRPDGMGELNIIGSLINGKVAVLLIEGSVDDVLLTRWVDGLTDRYGRVSARLAKSQAMWQWTRQRKMIRVTTRIEQANRLVSVSLVDGPILDAL
jgi:hypothetical protein